MKKLETQLKQLQNAHTMCESERIHLRSSLDEYMALNPIKSKSTNIQSTSWLLHAPLFSRKMIAMTLTIAIVLTSSGASYASADALPGDKLYKVKEIIEDVESAVTITDAGQAKLAKRLMRRREVEMRKLEEAGKLDEVHISIIERRIIKHRAEATRLIKSTSIKEPKQSEELKMLLNSNINSLKNAKLKRLDHYFSTAMSEIEADARVQDNILQELEGDIDEMDTVINNY